MVSGRKVSVQWQNQSGDEEVLTGYLDGGVFSCALAHLLDHVEGSKLVG